MSPTIQCSRHGMVREHRSHPEERRQRHTPSRCDTMATAVCGGGRPAAPREFCGSGKLKNLEGSDVVLTKQCNTCKHRDYVGQASRRYRPDTRMRPIRPIGPIREDSPNAPHCCACSRARFSKRVNSFRNVRPTSPVGPLRCLAIIKSASPAFSCFASSSVS